MLPADDVQEGDDIGDGSEGDGADGNGLGEGDETEATTAAMFGLGNLGDTQADALEDIDDLAGMREVADLGDDFDEAEAA